MSNRADLRGTLRYRLQETVEDQWSDARLNGLLNEGLRKLQLAILRHHPEAFFAMWRCDVVDASSDPERLRIYPWPEGLMRLAALKYRGATSDDYTPLDPMPYAKTLGRTAGTLKWAPLGLEAFVLSPIQTEAVADGIQVEGTELLSMSDDADVPGVHISLHDAIVYFAQIDALKDTGEPTAPIREDLAIILGQIPSVAQTIPGGGYVEVDV